VRAIFIDESATSSGSHDYLGGLVTDAPALRHIETEMDGLAEFIADQVDGVEQSIELHGHDMFHGKAEWEPVPLRLRVRACEIASRILAESGARMFFRGMDVPAQRRRYAQPFPAHELVLSQLISDIDKRLGPGRSLGMLGLCHADEHHSADSGRRNLRRFKIEAVAGHTERHITHIGDTIYFGPSHASRLLQAVDIATFFLNRVRHTTETDARARRSMAAIVGNIRSITVDEYVWTP